jgi:hypothetical protein
MKKPFILLSILLIGGFVFACVEITIHSGVKPVPHLKAAPLNPNKYHEPYSFSYLVDNIQVLVLEGASSYNANQTPKYYGFSIWYTNTTNKPVSYAPTPSLEIGCIVANDRNYKQSPAIFSPSVGALSFAPFETKKLDIQISPACQYVGTADGKYWWDVPRYGD